MDRWFCIKARTVLIFLPTPHSPFLTANPRLSFFRKPVIHAPQKPATRLHTKGFLQFSLISSIFFHPISWLREREPANLLHPQKITNL